MDIKLNSGSFFVDENLYYLYDYKETKTLEEIGYAILPDTGNLYIPSTTSNLTITSQTWSEAEYGIYLGSSEQAWFIDDGLLYVHNTSLGPYTLKGLYPVVNTSEGSIIYYQTELSLFSLDTAYLLEKDIVAPIVITDDSLLPVDPIVYQQHRFSLYDLDNFVGINFNKPKNYLIDPDFSNLYAYPGTYNYTSTLSMGLVGLNGSFTFSSLNLNSEALRLDVFAESDLSLSATFTDILDGSTQTFTSNVSMSSLGLSQWYFGTYDKFDIIENVNSYSQVTEFTSNILDNTLYNVEITLSSELIHFVQLTPDYKHFEFNNNSHNMTIEYGLSAENFESNISLDPNETMNNKGFLVFDEVYNDTTSSWTNDFQCTLRDTLPYAKIYGANKYKHYEIDMPELMITPDLEYRYGHDRQELGYLTLGHMDIVVTNTSYVSPIQLDIFGNFVENASLYFDITSEFNTKCAFENASLVTDNSGFCINELSASLITSEIVLTLTSGYYTSALEYEAFSNLCFSGDGGYYLFGKDYIETSFTGSFNFDTYSLFTGLSSYGQPENTFNLTVTGHIFDVEVYATNLAISGVPSLSAVTSFLYLQKSEDSFLESGEFSFDNNNLMINSDMSYYYVSYKSAPAFIQDNSLFIEEAFYSMLTSQITSSLVFAYDSVEEVVITNTSGYSVQEEIIIPDTTELLHGDFVGQVLSYTPPPIPPVPFWRITTTGSHTIEAIVINTTDSSTIDIDWGDGSSTTMINGGSYTHTYASAGTYDMTFAEVDFDRIQQVGDLYTWGTDGGAVSTVEFSNCRSIFLRRRDIASITLNNPLVWSLQVYDNELTSLDISTLPLLTEVWIHNNQLTAEVIDSILIALDSFGKYNGVLWYTNNPGTPDIERSAAAATAKTNLLAKSWTLYL